MKKIFLCLLTAFLIFQCGCSRIKGMDKESVITACYAAKSNETVSYTFYYAAQSNGGSEEENKSSGNSAFTVEAKNFSDATRLFYESMGPCDISHLSVMFLNSDYLNSSFLEDADHIKDNLKISPLIRVMLTDEPSEKIAEAVNKSYRSSFSHLSESLFSGERKKLVCTMSELYLSAKNPLFTSSVPSISIHDQTGNVTSDTMAIYNSSVGKCCLDSGDYMTYSSCLKKYGKTSRFIKPQISGGKIRIDLRGTDDEIEKMRLLANKYKTLGYDILNVLYYSKKCFMTYGAYYDFITGIRIGDVTFV